MVEGSLAAPEAAEIEAKHREVAVRKGIVQLIDDLVVHRAAVQGMRVQHDRDRRVLLPRRVIAALEPPSWTGENDLGHSRPRRNGLPRRQATERRLRA